MVLLIINAWIKQKTFTVQQAFAELNKTFISGDHSFFSQTQQTLNIIMVPLFIAVHEHDSPTQYTYPAGGW